MQNVIFLGVDSLRFDRLKAGGYTVDSAPTLTFLGENGVQCLEAVTNSGPTQMAFPSITTSTYPLDYGGYDNGIVSRPRSIAEIFKEAGYSTFGFGEDQVRSELCGYARGFDSYESIYDVDTIWKNSVIYLEYYKKIFNDGRVSRQEYIALNYDYFSRIIQQTIDYAADELREDSARREKFKDIYPYDFYRLKCIFEMHKKSLNNDKEKFISDYSDAVDINDYLTWLDFFRVYKNNMFFVFSIIKLFPRLKGYFYKIRGRLFKHFASTTYITDRLLDWLSEHKQKKVFAFIFFQDLHENVTSKGLSNAYHKDVNKFLKSSNNTELSFVDKITPSDRRKGSLLYDASLGYIDSEIKRIVDFLKKNEMLDNTLIVIFSDHGTQVGKECTRDLICSFMMTTLGFL